MFHQNNIELYLDKDPNRNFSIKYNLIIDLQEIQLTISVKLFVTIGILIKPQLNEIIEIKKLKIEF